MLQITKYILILYNIIVYWVPVISIITFLLLFIPTIIYGFFKGWKAAIVIASSMFLLTLTWIIIALIIYNSLLWPLYKDVILKNHINNNIDINFAYLSDVYKARVILIFVGFLTPITYIVTSIIYFSLKRKLTHHFAPQTTFSKSTHKKNVIKYKNTLPSKISGGVIIGISSLFTSSLVAAFSSVFVTPYDKRNGVNNFIDSISKIYSLGMAQDGKVPYYADAFLDNFNNEMFKSINEIVNFNTLDSDKNHLPNFAVINELKDNINILLHLFESQTASDAIFNSLFNNVQRDIDPLRYSSQYLNNDSDQFGNKIGYNLPNITNDFSELDAYLSNNIFIIDLPKSIKDIIIQSFSNEKFIEPENLIFVSEYQQAVAHFKDQQVLMQNFDQQYQQLLNDFAQEKNLQETSLQRLAQLIDPSIANHVAGNFGFSKQELQGDVSSSTQTGAHDQSRYYWYTLATNYDENLITSNSMIQISLDRIADLTTILNQKIQNHDLAELNFDNKKNNEFMIGANADPVSNQEYASKAQADHALWGYEGDVEFADNQRQVDANNLQSARDQINNITSELEQLNNLINNLAQENVDLTNENQIFSAQIAQLNVEKNTLEQALISLETDLSNKENTLVTLENQLTAIEQQLLSVTGDYHNSQITTDNMKVLLIQAQEDFDNYAQTTSAPSPDLQLMQLEQDVINAQQNYNNAIFDEHNKLLAMNQLIQDQTENEQKVNLAIVKRNDAQLLVDNQNNAIGAKNTQILSLTDRINQNNGQISNNNNLIGNKNQEITQKEQIVSNIRTIQIPDLTNVANASDADYIDKVNKLNDFLVVYNTQISILSDLQNLLTIAIGNEVDNRKVLEREELNKTSLENETIFLYQKIDDVNQHLTTFADSIELFLDETLVLADIDAMDQNGLNNYNGPQTSINYQKALIKIAYERERNTKIIMEQAMEQYDLAKLRIEQSFTNWINV